MVVNDVPNAQNCAWCLGKSLYCIAENVCAVLQAGFALDNSFRDSASRIIVSV